MEVETIYEAVVEQPSPPLAPPEGDQGSIRIKTLDQLCEVEGSELKGYENEGEPEAEKEVDGNGSLPFSCALCPSKFKKKLFLNNHMEKRHGIKFVFTEKGKKVKLVRMPQQVAEGEKLDPCVEALMQQNGQNSSNILGVQTVEQNTRGDGFTAAHEVDPHDLLQGRTDREFGCGILVKEIRTFAMKKARERKETPFVAYRPLRSKRLYLLTIQTLNESTQLLLPATDADLSAAEGVQAEPSFYFTHVPFNPTQQSTPVPQAMRVMKKSCTRFSQVAIVALAEQSLSEDNKLQIRLLPPPPAGPVSLIKSAHFSRTIVQSHPKRLRCLSLPPKPIARPPVEDDIRTPRVKRKYTRRNPFTKRAKRAGEMKRRYRRAGSSDEETEFDGASETSTTDYDEVVVPRLSRVRSSKQSPIYLPRREHGFSPTRKSHPIYYEELEPPKRKYTRRGRKPKALPDGKQLKRMRLAQSQSDKENCDGQDSSPRPPKDGDFNEKDTQVLEDGNEGDQESEGGQELKMKVMAPVKKRGRGRPRKNPLPE